MPKSFFPSGPICREDHYYVPRDDKIDCIVQKLLFEDSFVLLHAHRQAVKSTLLLPITESLEEKEHVVINISLQGIGSDDNFWESLSVRINIVYDVKGIEFHDAPGFLQFLPWQNFQKNVYLLLDEIDQLFSTPKICENFLSTLRVTKTMRNTNSKHGYALAGVLGIGVYHVIKLVLSSTISPFNTCDLFRLPQPSEEAVCQMFTSFGRDVDLDLSVFGRDIYART